MTTKRLGLIMNGVTGRMGLNQHLIRSIIAIRDSGGVLLSNGDRMLPDPILIGRDADKVEALAKRFNVPRWYLEGSATFMETWMGGGLGRAQVQLGVGQHTDHVVARVDAAQRARPAAGPGSRTARGRVSAGPRHTRTLAAWPPWRAPGDSLLLGRRAAGAVRGDRRSIVSS